MPPGGDVTCTITNNDQPAQLTLVKVVVNDNGGTAVPSDWTLTAAGPTPISGRRQQPGGDRPDRERRHLRPVRDRRPAGYTASAWSCAGGALTGASVAVPLGGDVTCTITNNDQPAQLTLVKVVDERRRRAPRSPLTGRFPPTGPTPITGTTGSAEVTDATGERRDLHPFRGRPGSTWLHRVGLGVRRAAAWSAPRSPCRSAVT